MSIRRVRNSGIPFILSPFSPIHELRPTEPYFRIMTSEESALYSRIIAEQIALQNIQAESFRLRDEDMGEGKRLTIARQIKTQRAVLSRLWERARALKDLAGSGHPVERWKREPIKLCHLSGARSFHDLACFELRIPRTAPSRAFRFDELPRFIDWRDL